MSALQAGVLGMLAHQLRLDAIGNNIANANTVGYKSARVLFADTLYQLLEPATAPTANLGGTNPSSVGQGVLVTGMDTFFGQGGLMLTGRTTDVAIEGEGFLAVTDGVRIFYTRNGALGLDAGGHLVHLASGLRVIALPAPAASPGSVNNPTVTPTSTLQLPVGQSSLARATSQVRLGANLDSRTAPGTQYPVSFRVYDSLGAGHEVTLTFTRSATEGRWDVTGTSPDGTISLGAPAQITFDERGKPTVGALPIQMTLSNPNGANSTLEITLSVADVTQLAQESSAALLTQDGVPPGTLTGLTINGDGLIVGVYSNGLMSSLGRLVTAVFSNTGGLQSERHSLFSATVNSGEPTYGTPGSGNRGAVRSGQLESSNVNLAQEFADMIVTQRGFQASARVVTTADQMLQELMNLAR